MIFITICFLSTILFFNNKALLLLLQIEVVTLFILVELPGFTKGMFCFTNLNIVLMVIIVIIASVRLCSLSCLTRTTQRDALNRRASLQGEKQYDFNISKSKHTQYYWSQYYFYPPIPFGLYNLNFFRNLLTIVLCVIFKKRKKGGGVRKINTCYYYPRVQIIRVSSLFPCVLSRCGGRTYSWGRNRWQIWLHHPGPALGKDRALSCPLLISRPLKGNQDVYFHFLFNRI